MINECRVRTETLLNYSFGSAALEMWEIWQPYRHYWTDVRAVEQTISGRQERKILHAGAVIRQWYGPEQF